MIIHKDLYLVIINIPISLKVQHIFHVVLPKLMKRKIHFIPEGKVMLITRITVMTRSVLSSFSKTKCKLNLKQIKIVQGEDKVSDLRNRAY